MCYKDPAIRMHAAEIYYIEHWKLASIENISYTYITIDLYKLYFKEDNL